MKIDVLRLKGKGEKRLGRVLQFFTLAAAYRWPGQLWIRRPSSGRLRPWQLIYEGSFVKDYYDLLSKGDWPETITIESLDADSLKVGELWPE